MHVKWVEYDGYDRVIQLVNTDTGRILGEVRGSRFRKQDGWVAFDETKHPYEHLGRYVDEEHARMAVYKQHFSIEVQPPCCGATVGIAHDPADRY